MNVDVAILGPFPPPLGGAAKNNALLLDELRASGLAVRKLNVSGNRISHTRGIRYHFTRLARNFFVASRIAFTKGTVLYVVPDGGMGIYYTVFHLFLGLWGFQRFVIHHRTFRYIDFQSTMMKLITRMTKTRARHVFLTEGMRAKFVRRYGDVDSLIATNAIYVAPALSETETRRVAPANPNRIRIGHLSNLCREKGFYDVVSTFELAYSQGIDLELHLAGPAVEPGVEAEISRLKDTYEGRVFAYGQLAGEQKNDFYRTIDFFLFPTRFSQEAAPNVIYEAFAGGSLVLSVDRACIPEMITERRGAVCTDIETFPEFAVEQLQSFDCDIDSRQRIVRDVVEFTRRDITESQGQHTVLLQSLGVNVDG